MRWIALLLVCVGLALAYAIGELTRDGEAGTELPERHARAAPPDVPPTEPEPEREAPRAPAPQRGEKAGAASNLYYQYIDGANQVQFARSLEEVPEEWRARAGRVSLPVPPPAAPARRAGGQKAAPAVRHHEGTFSAARSAERTDQPAIEIYTLKSCGYCRKAMAYMDTRGLEYTNRDIEEEPEAREEYLEKTNGRAGVPVIDIEGEILQGWSKQHFETVLAAQSR